MSDNKVHPQSDRDSYTYMVQRRVINCQLKPFRFVESQLARDAKRVYSGNKRNQSLAWLFACGSGKHE